MNPYESYALLNAQIEILEQQKDELKEKIIKDMIDKGEKKVDTSLGSIALQAGKKKWTYSEKINKDEEKLKADKALEQSTGDAEYTEGDPFIKFNPIKL
jgi:hypothetical protein